MRRTSFAGPSGAIELRVHAPQESSTSGLVFFHGGAVRAASFAVSATFCDALASAGNCHVLAVDSALISAPRFPQVVDEAYFVVCHLHELAEDFGVDHRRIAIGGEGFGGALAAAVARLAKERRNPSLLLQLLVDPLLDLREPRDAALRDFVERYLPDPAQRGDPRASPGLATNLIGLPAACLITTSQDAQRGAVDAYAAALRNAYVPSETTHLQAGPAAADVLPACAEALRKALA